VAYYDRPHYGGFHGGGPGFGRGRGRGWGPRWPWLEGAGGDGQDIDVSPPPPFGEMGENEQFIGDVHIGPWSHSFNFWASRDEEVLRREWAKGSRDLDKITDAVFYARHPEWSGKKLPRERGSQAIENLKNEWKYLSAIAGARADAPIDIQAPAGLSQPEFDVSYEQPQMYRRRRQRLSGQAEFEAPDPASDPRLFAFKIPEAPYSDRGIEAIHKTVDVIESVHTAFEVFAPEAAGILGIAAAALTPLLAEILPFSVPFAEARAEISRKNVKIGFEWGVVAGADGRKWADVKDLFWMWSPDSNPDRDLAVVAQKALNSGLVAGFLQGREVARNPKKKEFFWRSIGWTLSQADLGNYGGNTSGWGRQEWLSWYIRASKSFDQLYVSD
jgi:hypothetical protein